MKGTLYVVSTPIGNLEDITLRALRVLKEVDIIAAEDTRHSRKLLTHYGISKPLMSYWGEREKTRSTEILQRLRSGQSVAIISDAGTPGVSDPGTVVIKKALEEGNRVISVPGPSAIIAALSISGLPTEEFMFLGFLPAKKTQRRKLLEDLSLEQRTLIFYEAPHRILETLLDMKEVFGERKAVLVKELSKIYEEVLRGSISGILETLKKSTIAGEYVILIEGRTQDRRVTAEAAILEVGLLMKKGLGRKESVKRIAEAYGLSKKELYYRSLSID